MVLFVDVEYGLLNTLTDLEAFEGKPVYARYMPDHECIVLATTAITPQKVMRWWNADHANDPEILMSAPPELQRVRFAKS